MNILLRRGKESKRNTITPLRGELLIGFDDVTDKPKLYMGNGVNVGGLPLSDNIGSTWTPIITGDGTVENAMYTRIDNIVTFSLRLSWTSSTATFTLPIASDFRDISDLIGTVICFPDVGTEMRVEADVSLNQGSVRTVSSATNALITGQYIIR